MLAAQRMLEAKYRDATRGADDWQRRAELAVRAGNDELAREALRRKKAFTVRDQSQVWGSTSKFWVVTRLEL